MKKWLILAVVALSTLLSGCGASVISDAKQGVDNVSKQAYDINQAATKPAPTVVVEHGYYVDTAPVKFDHTPKALRQNVQIHADGMPMDLLLKHTLGDTHLVVTFDNTVSPRKTVTLDYSGSLKGALDQIAEQTGYAYSLSGNHLSWSAFETRTFDISFMPGASSYSLGGKFRDEKQSGEGGDSGKSAAAEDEQYSELKGDLSIWKDLQATLDNLKSPKGEVMISQASTTATVRDYPQNVDAIARYIKKLNNILSQEVQLKVRVIELSLSKSFSYGIDWNLLDQKIGSFHFGITGSAGSATTLGAGAASDGLTKLIIGKKNQQAFLQALSEQGRLSVVTQPTVVTLNNQIASIKITQNTTYIKSLTNTVNNTSGGTGSGNSTTTISSTITPGSITDGFILYLLPKIQHERVFLQITSTISSLLSLDKVSTAPPSSAAEDASGSSSGDNQNTSYQAIQAPTISSKQFNIRARVESGSTLVLAGFQSLRNQSESASPLGIQPLGGQGAEKKNVQTLVLITPVIVKK